MSSSELFPQRVPQEAPFFGPEITTQQLYVQELSAHAETIPDLSRLKPYDGLTFEASQLLGNYCTDSEYSTEGLVEKGVTPLYREDIIDPYFCKSVSSLTMKAAGQKDSGAHWYAPIRRDVPAFGYGRDSREAQWASRQWERFYVGYMRQRRFFHVAFMQTLVDKTPIDPLIQVIGLENGKPVQIPNAGLNGNKQTDPALLYDKTNWLTASLLSALCLPPERCDAGMKRQAIEQWAAHVDLGGADSLDFYQLSERHGPMRLPWSMRSNSDLRTRHHLQWHQNPIIKGYLGERWQPRADGLEALLQERPKDYVQILILQAMERSSSGEGLRDLANAAALDPQIKDIIFADDAAHNTVFSDKPVFAEYEQPTTLAELLAQLGEDLAPQAQETIIEGQRLRIQVLEGELAAAQKGIRNQSRTIRGVARGSRWAGPRAYAGSRGATAKE